LQGIDDIPQLKKEEKNRGLAMSYYDDYEDEDDYETNEEEAQLKEIIKIRN
jgi:hypothetical protein